MPPTISLSINETINCKDQSSALKASYMVSLYLQCISPQSAIILRNIDGITQKIHQINLHTVSKLHYHEPSSNGF